MAAQLDRRCNGQYDHVHLVSGRASSAPVYPQPLCEAMLQGIAQQKRVDSGRKLIAPKMNNNRLNKFVGSVASVDTRKVASSGLTAAPIGQWSRHWVDPVHEEDGGDDKFGPRHQCGIDICKAELDALSYGVAYARDGVTVTALLPVLVVQARLEEMTYFKKLGVYKVVPRAHQRQHGGQIIGTRWVDTNTRKNTQNT